MAPPGNARWCLIVFFVGMMDFSGAGKGGEKMRKTMTKRLWLVDPILTGKRREGP